jgi:probable rRNA maturation factor
VSSLRLHLQNDDGQPAPPLHQFQEWVAAALTGAGHERTTELTVRIVGEQEMRELNQRYRQISRATNVLSFAAGLPPHLQLPLLGDIVICAPLVAREAQQQQKSSSAHWAHMVIHGTLHLLGYDHIEDADADAMEHLETLILRRLQIAAPYENRRQKPEKSAPQ